MQRPLNITKGEAKKKKSFRNLEINASLNIIPIPNYRYFNSSEVEVNYPCFVQLKYFLNVYTVIRLSFNDSPSSGFHLQLW